MKTILITVIRSTPKAHLVKDHTGREAWIQARSLQTGNIVNAATFEKAVVRSAEYQAAKAVKTETEAAERRFRDSAHLVPVVKESEKAVAAAVVVEFAGDQDTKLVWFPKSMIGGADGLAEIPGWMIRERETEITGKCGGTDYYSRHRFAKGERGFLVRGVEVLATLI